MKNFLTICVSLFLLSACGPGAAGGNPSSTANPSSAPSAAASNPAGSATISGSVTASKPAYLAFLNCVKARHPEKAEDLDVRIGIVNGYAEAQWSEYKPLADNQVRTVFSTMGQGCGI